MSPPLGTVYVQSAWTLLHSSLVRTNEQVKGDYIVNISENKAAPDAVIKSTNGQLRACVYLQGVVPRTAEVLLETTNSSIASIFPDKDPEQPVTCSVRSTNGECIPYYLHSCPSYATADDSMSLALGKVDVGFPTTYNGTITTRTTHGKINISDSMRANSVPEGSPSNLTTYRIRPQATLVTRDDKSDEDDDAADEILDTCHIQTTNGAITLAYLSEVDKADNSTDKKESSSCIIS
jgi:hypothetical protein